MNNNHQDTVSDYSSEISTDNSLAVIISNTVVENVENSQNNDRVIVTTLDDEDDGDVSQQDLSLREAINLANSGDIITFDSSLSGGTITLSAGELRIDKSLTIDGLSANNLTIDANQQSRVFNLNDGQDNTIQNINLNGLNITGGGNVANGGGVYNQEDLRISNTTLNDNVSDDRGGAIANHGTVAITNTTITNNSATTGGGINNSDSGVLSLYNSTITNNFGGGVFNANDNSASVGSSIIAHNTSSDVIFTTVTPGTNTDDDVIGTEAFISDGNNLIGVVDGFGSFAFDSFSAAGFVNGENGDLVGTASNPIDPQLKELQDNGGATLTQELLAGSPAIDTGSNLNDLATDQRGVGFNRTVGNGIDIGAFEVQDGCNRKNGDPHPGAIATLEDDFFTGTNDNINVLKGNHPLYEEQAEDIIFGNNSQDIFALQPDQRVDVILDFTDGSDLFGLTNGLYFGNLSIVNNDCGDGVIIQDASNNNMAIAFVNNIDATNITEDDFITL